MRYLPAAQIRDLVIKVNKNFCLYIPQITYYVGKTDNPFEVSVSNPDL